MLNCKFCGFKSNIEKTMVDHIFRSHLTQITTIKDCYSGEIERVKEKELFLLPKVPSHLPLRETAFYQFLIHSEEQLSTVFYEDLCLFAPSLVIGKHKLEDGQFDTYKLIHSEFCFRMLRNMEP